MKSLVVILLCLGIIMIVTGYNKSMINNNRKYENRIWICS